jgi:hypothetical protein
MLVGLCGKAAGQAETAALATVPGSAHGVGAILDQDEIVFSDDGSELLHVGQMTAHVRQKEEPRAGCTGLAVEILKIDHKTLGDFHQQGLSTGSSYGAGDRGKGEAVGENGFPRAEPRRTQGDGHGIPSRGASEAIARALVGGIGLFELRGFGKLFRSAVVAMQAAGSQDLGGGRNDRVIQCLLLGKTAGERFQRPASLARHPAFFRNRTKPAPILIPVRPHPYGQSSGERHSIEAIRSLRRRLRDVRLQTTEVARFHRPGSHHKVAQPRKIRACCCIAAEA